MNQRYRKTVIAGNWKMYKTPSETKAFFDEMKTMISRVKWCEVVLCVPFVDIPAALKATKGFRVSIAAQNMHFEKNGAYTGEISAQMLAELGVKYVIIGHSERRQYFAETNETVNKKVHAALDAGLRPIVCVGESLQQREQGITLEFIREQVKIALGGVEPTAVMRVIMAYEPIWAIGTGKTATADQAEEVCGWIRDCIRELYGARIARAVTIQYGGSMKPGNAAELLSKLDVDGGLIGGASLKPADFVQIINAANQQ